MEHAQRMFFALFYFSFSFSEFSENGEGCIIDQHYYKVGTDRAAWLAQ